MVAVSSEKLATMRAEIDAYLNDKRVSAAEKTARQASTIEALWEMVTTYAEITKTQQKQNNILKECIWILQQVQDGPTGHGGVGLPH